jgi:hypothetical protein
MNVDQPKRRVIDKNVTAATGAKPSNTEVRLVVLAKQLGSPRHLDVIRLPQGERIDRSP